VTKKVGAKVKLVAGWFGCLFYLAIAMGVFWAGVVPWA
jgi:hypothetical protein